MANNRRRNTLSSNFLYQLIISFIILIPAIVCLLPLLHVLAISLSAEGPANANIVGLWPVGFNIKAYNQALRDPKMIMAFGITAKRVVLGVIVNMGLTTLLAYPLSHDKREFPFRNIYVWFVFFTMIFHGGLIPLYILIKELGLMNNIWALILPQGVPVFNVIIMINFFRQIDKSMSESAQIEGANHFTIMLKIYIPLSLPVFATLTLFCFVQHWNEWFFGLIFMQDVKKYPLQTYIQTLLAVMNEAPGIEEAKRMAAISRRSLLFARILLAVVPILIFYPYLQKYYKSGLVIGSVKG